MRVNSNNLSASSTVLPEETFPFKLSQPVEKAEKDIKWPISQQKFTDERGGSFTLELGPLGSAAALGIAWYMKRGLFINPFNQDKYDKGTKIVAIGKPFTYKLEAEVNKIKQVQAFKGRRTLAGIPLPKSLEKRSWCEWLKHDKSIRGGKLLPSWLQYHARKNQLISHFNPRQEDTGLYVVRAYGHGGVILEEVKLSVGEQESKNVEMLEMS